MKTIDKKYYVCEICGKTSQNEEKIRGCQESHQKLDGDCKIAPEYRKGIKYPSNLTITYPDGAKQVFSNSGVFESKEALKNA